MVGTAMPCARASVNRKLDDRLSLEGDTHRGERPGHGRADALSMSRAGPGRLIHQRKPHTDYLYRLQQTQVSTRCAACAEHVSDAFRGHSFPLGGPAGGLLPVLSLIVCDL